MTIIWTTGGATFVVMESEAEVDEVLLLAQRTKKRAIWLTLKGARKKSLFFVGHIVAVLPAPEEEEMGELLLSKGETDYLTDLVFEECGEDRSAGISPVEEARSIYEKLTGAAPWRGEENGKPIHPPRNHAESDGPEEEEQEEQNE